MGTLHLLGTGAALSGPRRTTTMLALEAERSILVVDCGGDVVQRMQAADLSLGEIAALFLTHEHPDHVGGFPLFMEKIWLAGRREPVPVYGPEAALSQARRLFEAFDTSGWEGLPEIRWHPVELRQNVEVLRTEQWHVTAAPGTHSVPVLGIRVEDLRGGGTVAYSSDTERSDRIAELASGADVLVHEATGAFSGHSSGEDAAAVAMRAGVRRLILVHLPPDAEQTVLPDAQRGFAGAELGTDGARVEF